MDNISEARLQELYPPLADKARQGADILSGEGIVIRVTQGLRSWSQQHSLWLQGRDPAGNVVDKRKVVTNADGGHSWHNLGLAFDVCPDDPTLAGFQADWDLAHPAWKRIVEVYKGLGLDSGATWRTFKDWPHFQMTGRFPEGAPDGECRQLFRDGGMQAVWAELGQ